MIVQKNECADLVDMFLTEKEFSLICYLLEKSSLKKSPINDENNLSKKMFKTAFEFLENEL